MRVHEIVRLLLEAGGTPENINPNQSKVYLQIPEAIGTLRICTYFPMQNRPKISPSRSSAPNAPVISERRS